MSPAAGKVLLFATLDTKGREADYVRGLLRGYGVDCALIDTGCVGAPTVAADVPRERVFAAAGTSHAAVLAAGDRGLAVTKAAEGARSLALAAHAAGELGGVLGLGGSAGTTIGTAAMRALPLGVPKLMVSTLASGEVRQYVGDKDVLMLNSVVDISGLNRISRVVLGEAARAMAGMLRFAVPLGSETDRPLVAASMFGVTTPCVERARELLEGEGYEVLVFHATGNGGEALESLVREGLVAGVLDVTTTELADELVGGVLSAGPTRLTAAGERGVPQVVSVGALDMVNFLGRASVPERFAGRTFYKHNDNVTLMRTTPAENRALGAEIGAKLSAATGPTALFLPLRGVSAIDRAGQPFDDPAARAALFDALRASASAVERIELDLHLNDPDFALAMARRLVQMMRARTPA